MTKTMNGAFAHVWTYRVRPAARADFIKAYGPVGDWARFYSHCPEYIRTDLLVDENDPDRFSTIDYFTTKESRDSFVAANKDEFEEIDRRWEDATVEEAFVGLYNVQSSV